MKDGTTIELSEEERAHILLVCATGDQSPTQESSNTSDQSLKLSEESYNLFEHLSYQKGFYYETYAKKIEFLQGYAENNSNNKAMQEIIEAIKKAGKTDEVDCNNELSQAYLKNLLNKIHRSKHRSGSKRITRELQESVVVKIRISKKAESLLDKLCSNTASHCQRKAKKIKFLIDYKAGNSIEEKAKEDLLELIKKAGKKDEVQR